MYHYLPLLLLLYVSAPTLGLGQDTLHFANPSFEDTPQHSHTPQGWANVGFAQQSPPDTGPTDLFGSSTQAADGKSFLVLVTRDNGTWERVSGTLNQALQPSQAYQLQLQLAKSATYFSQSPIIQKEVNFAFPVRLRIWGAKQDGEARELLAQSPAITHTDWRSYTFDFEAMLPYSQLILEAYYADDTALPYPGNLCIDGLSAIIPIQDSPTDLRERRMIAVPYVQKSLEEVAPVLPVAQAQLRELLDNIQPGQLDQGLYDLAVYQRSLRQPSWIIYVKQDGSKAARRFKRQLKQQIAAMNLEGHLSVDNYISAFQTMEWLSTPVNGSLGLQKQ